MRWFKFSDTMMYDPDIQKLAMADRWVWVILLSYASQAREGGYLREGINSNYIERMTNSTGVESAVKKLEDVGMIKVIKGRYYIVNWKKYQSEYERVSSYKRKPKVTKEVKVLNPDVERMCSLLKTLILKNNSNAKINTSNWSNKADEILRLDKRPIIEVLNVISWCQNDEFWKANILSMSKLRIQYDRLLLLSRKKKIGQVSHDGGKQWLEKKEGL